MEKKYRTEKEGDMLRIIALKDFSNVKKGDRGGRIECKDNLSQEGDCWVYENAGIYDRAEVCGNAVVEGYASVYDNARVYERAIISGAASVSGDARVFGNAKVYNWAQVYGKAQIYGEAEVSGYAKIYENAKVYENVAVCGNACVSGNARICGVAWVCRTAKVSGNVKLWSTKRSHITTPINDSKDHTILVIKQRFRIYPSNIKDVIDIEKEDFSIIEENFLKNIQTIRQLYVEEV